MDDIKWWNDELPPMEVVKQCNCDSPTWVQRNVKDKIFGVTLYAIRTCTICGVTQIYNYAEGRHGGMWRATRKTARVQRHQSGKLESGETPKR